MFLTHSGLNLWVWILWLWGIDCIVIPFITRVGKYSEARNFRNLQTVISQVVAFRREEWGSNSLIGMALSLG
jgi:hypothetical protein